jgi:L-lactate dehydrogenase
MAYATSILGNSLANELALVDILEDKLKGGMLNQQHGGFFFHVHKTVAIKITLR